MRKKEAGHARLIAAGALFCISVLGVAIGVLWPDRVLGMASRAVEALRGLQEGGIAVLATAQVLVAVSGLLPAALLGVAAGALYGLPLGFAAAASGTLAGALIAFLLARSLLRDRIARWLKRRRRLAAVDAMIAADGWRIVCLLRVSPVMPFSATSYALGLTSISTRDYMIGTLASLPALFGYVLLGSLADAGVAAWSSGATPLRWALLAIGMAATIVFTLRVGQLAIRAGLGARAAQP